LERGREGRRKEGVPVDRTAKEQKGNGIFINSFIFSSLYVSLHVSHAKRGREKKREVEE